MLTLRERLTLRRPRMRLSNPPPLLQAPLEQAEAADVDAAGTLNGVTRAVVGTDAALAALLAPAAAAGTKA